MPALLLVAAAYIAGTLAAAVLGGPWWWAAAVAAALAVALRLREGPATARLSEPHAPHALGAPSTLVLIAAVALVAAGHARYAEVDARPSPNFANLEGEHDVVAVARDDALLSGSVARVDVRVELIDGEPAEGGVRLTLPAPSPPTPPIRAGDRLSMRVELEPLPEVEAFDFAGYLRSRGIHALAAYPKEGGSVIGHEGGGVAGRLRALRRWAVGNIERSLPEPAAALAAGMLIGERSTLPAAVAEDLRVTGTTHLIVVSGQNVALLLGTAIGLLMIVVSRRRASVITLALLVPYVLLVGADPPVVRAAIMAVGIAVASVAGRRTPGWVYLLYAGAIMLAIDPLLARDVAFQLSMSATVGVMLVAPPLRDAALGALRWEERRVRAALIEVAATATGAALAVVPVQAATFEQLPLMTIPANILVAPLYEATLVVAVVAALGGWFDPLASLVSATGRFVPQSFLGLVDLLAAVPATVVPVRLPLEAGIAWYAALGAAVWAIERRMTVPIALAPPRRTGAELTVGLAIVAAGLWFVVLSGGDDGRARITVLDVGQGLAVLVQDRGVSVLIDTGPPDGAVLLALPAQGVTRRLDALLLTHTDADHAGGLRDTERRIAVGTLIASAGTLEALSLRGEAIDIGDRIRLSDRTSIEVLSPPVQTAQRAHESDNNGSFVLMVTIGDLRVLLTADIEEPAERWLTASGLDLRAEAIVVPHHGSATSSTAAFVEAVSARVAIVSVGADNRFGHPVPEVLERYGDALLYRTDEHGSVTLFSDGERLWVESER